MVAVKTSLEIVREDKGQKLFITADELGENKMNPVLGEAPDGGIRAWLVATGAAFVFFSALGYANSFGVLQEYYMTHQLHNESPDNIAWIGSMSAFLQFAVSAVAGPLFDFLGEWIIRPAAALFVFSMMMTSLCYEYWHFMLAQGVLMGVAIAFLMFPAMAAVSQYFDKNRAAALGLAVSGSSIGSVVIPIALSKMLNSSSLGFGWTVHLIGFVMLLLLAFSCVAIKARLPPRKTLFFTGLVFKDSKLVLLIVSLFFMFLGMLTPLSFIPTYAVTRGIDSTLASYLLAILNAASIFSRIIPGILADRFGRLNVLALGGITTAIVIFCLNKAETTAALVLYSVAFGFSSGTIISGAAAAFTLCLDDPRDIGTYIGMGMAASSIAALIGPPVSGALIKKYGGFFEVSLFSGIMCLIGGCTALMSKTVTPQSILGRT